MMALSVLLDRLKLEPLLTPLDGVCEPAATRTLDSHGVLARGGHDGCGHLTRQTGQSHR